MNRDTRPCYILMVGGTERYIANKLLRKYLIMMTAIENIKYGHMIGRDRGYPRLRSRKGLHDTVSFELRSE